MNKDPRPIKITAILVLIVLNVILYIITSQFGIEDKMIRWFALFFPKNDHFRYWQFVTNMFMHGGSAHLIFNMFGLWSFGTPLEQMWGMKKFLFFYFLCGIGAGLIYTLVNYFQFNLIYNELINMGISATDIQNILKTGNYNPEVLTAFPKERLEELYGLFNTPAVGASGAIYGVMVAFGFLFPNAKLALIFLPVPIAAKYFIPILLALDLFSGITGSSILGGDIAHFAHIGGAIIGFLLVWYWNGFSLQFNNYEEPLP